MNKKIGLICAALVSCFLLASFSPSLDGRAVVADDGAFPSGLFAKTVGYLPGDSITVSNLSAQKTADILVVGALDPSEGVAILLSPEAAAAPGIEKNSNVIVKITKRSGQLDETVSGTAIVTPGTAETASAEKAAPVEETAPAEKAAPVEETAPAEKAAPVEEIAASEEPAPAAEETA